MLKFLTAWKSGVRGLQPTVIHSVLILRLIANICLFSVVYQGTVAHIGFGRERHKNCCLKIRTACKLADEAVVTWSLRSLSDLRSTSCLAKKRIRGSTLSS